MSAPDQPRARGFRQTGALLQARIRKVGESRGFAVSKLLTRWAEVAGPDIAALCRPVEVGYGRQGLGATLTVLTTGAAAPLVEMQKEALRQRVNACYGYNAVARVKITQTSAHGFAETQTAYQAEPDTPAPAVIETARSLAADIGDDRLRAALERMGANILSRPGQT